MGCSDIYISRQSRTVSFEISRSSSSIFLLIFKGVDSVIEFIQKNPYCPSYLFVVKLERQGCCFAKWDFLKTLQLWSA